VKLRLVVITSLLGGALTGQATGAEAQCPDSANKFWKAFRQTVINGEKNKVVKSVKFPFEIRGTLDTSDKRKVNKEAFLATFQLLTATDPGLAPQRSTMANLIKSTPKLGANSCSPSGDEFTVGTWDFVLTAKGWRFVRAFIED
jgi:hypothetical protein